MSAVLAVARADLLERSRTFATLTVLAVVLELGYLCVPDRGASYATVDLGGWRGIYNSAWMGVSTALLTASLLPLLGFFLIRPAQSRDALLGTYDLIVSAPLARVFVVLGKWLSNVAVLGAVAGLLAVAALVMQLVRGEDAHIELAAYAVPFALVTLPACAVGASLALVIAALPGLRGFAGGVVWFFVWSALIVVPLSSAGPSAAAFDPLGVTVLTHALLHAPGALVAGQSRSDLSIGISEPALHTFVFTQPVWTAAVGLQRAAWTAAAVLIVAAASSFALVPGAKRSRGRFEDVPATLAARLPLPPLVRAQFGAAIGHAGMLWCAGAAVLAVLALGAPADLLARAVVPLSWIWPIGPVAFATVMDARAGCDDVLRATPTPGWRRALARSTSCFLLMALPLAAVMLRAGPAGIAVPALAFSVAAVAVAAGTLTRSALLFEGTALLVWYAGAVNHVPFLDPAGITAAPVAVIGACAGVTGCAVGIAGVAAARRS